jgi:hypothetical protein
MNGNKVIHELKILIQRNRSPRNTRSGGYSYYKLENVPEENVISYVALYPVHAVLNNCCKFTILELKKRYRLNSILYAQSDSKLLSGFLLSIILNLKYQNKTAYGI